MRVLVEQTVQQARTWLRRAEPWFAREGRDVPSVHVLMGGETSTTWVTNPDAPTMLVGTQDMLLSRALLRGYGMSRYQWPIHFALLHNDVVWVYDEVQLMGPALGTSAQLDAFRRALGCARACHSVWMSATLAREWLATVDFAHHTPALRRLGLDEADRGAAPHLIEAAKRLHRSPVGLDKANGRTQARGYIAQLADEVRCKHRPGTQTLVILNRVSRAQDLYRALVKKGVDPNSLLLLHARFRPAERAKLERRLQDVREGGRIVVATQAVEAGVNITCATLWTELAPWSSMVQRFGRCNRYGEVEGGADVYWIDIDESAAELPLPYPAEELDVARSLLGGLRSAAMRDLPPAERRDREGIILRRKDFEQLFDTEPDLSGFDLDVSPYIRDEGSPQVLVFWRALADDPGEEPLPRREELCAASMSQISAYLRKKVRGEARRVWRWDPLPGRWTPVRNRQLSPGGRFLLDAALGGYDVNLGFRADHVTPVEPLPSPPESCPEEAFGADREASQGTWITLADHTARVVSVSLADRLGLAQAEREALIKGAQWHDVGKAHPAFQHALRSTAHGDSAPPPHELLAKSPGTGRLRYGVPSAEGEGTEPREYFRHELASLLAWLRHGEDDDLVAYLIAAHHGKIRLSIRALPDERPAPGGRRFARGVWDGDVLPPVQGAGLDVPQTELQLGVMELGLGSNGPSWTERTATILRDQGPFRLAWLEALLRLADQRASAAEAGDPDGLEDALKEKA